MNSFDSIVSIIVCDSNGRVLKEELMAEYADIEDVNVELDSAHNIERKSYLYILVGNADAVDEKIHKLNGSVIELLDCKLINLVNEPSELCILRKQIIAGILAPLLIETLIDIDITDILDIVQGANDIYISVVNSKEVSKLEEIHKKLIMKAGVDMSRCSRAYLYVEGDVSLMEINEIATSLDKAMGNDKYIAFTAVYNSSVENEYNAVVLFAS